MHRFDTHLEYGLLLSKGSVLAVYVDVFNLFNFQEITGVNQTYTTSELRPIVDGKPVRGEGLDLHPDQAPGGDAEIQGAVRTVHQHGHPRHDPLAGADDLEGLLHPAALGDDVLDHQHPLARGDLESAPQHQPALLLLGEDEPEPELTGDFLPDHQPAHGGGDDGGGRQVPELGGQRGSEPLDQGHLLQRNRALEKLAAVQTAPENEMAVEQRARRAERLQGFLGGHGVVARRKRS